MVESDKSAEASEQKSETDKHPAQEKQSRQRARWRVRKPAKPATLVDPYSGLCQTVRLTLTMPRGAIIPHGAPRRLFSVALLSLFLTHTPAVGQVAGSFGHPDTIRTVESTAADTGVLTFKVYAERNGTRLGRQAVVKLVNLTDQSIWWRSTEDNSECVITDVAYGDYQVEVSAVGYLSAHQPLKMVSNRQIQDFDIVLHRDPAAINLDVAGSVLSPRARKETKRAILALKSANLSEAQKDLAEAYKTAPTSPEVNFLLGYLYFEKKDFSQAGAYLRTATSLNPHNGQALTLLGRAGLERQDYAAARSALEQAVLADAENWVPHNLLADTYLHQKDYGKARDEAQVAIAKGKKDASPAQLVLGEALVNLGENQEGVRALNLFLKQSPQHPVAGQVRNLIAELDELASNPTAGEEGQRSTRLSGVDPLLAFPAPRLSLNSWQPPHCSA